MEATQFAPRVIRPVGSSAKFNTSRHSLGLCRSVILTCRYAAPKSNLAGGSIRCMVEKALAIVIHKHPMLRVGIADEDSANPVFVELQAIDLRHVTEWKEANCQHSDDYATYLLHSIEAQHDQLWEHLGQRPAWKIIVHQNAVPELTEVVHLDISFAFHHAIGDGQSAVIFHRDLLRALNGASLSVSDVQNHVVHLVLPTDLPQSLETIVPFSISWLYFMGIILNRIWTKHAPSWLRSEPAHNTMPWTGKQICLEPYKTNLRLLHVAGKNVASLVAACRENGTSLTPLFHALALASISSRLPSASAPVFRASTPISLRGFTLPEFDRETTMHCLVTEHEHLFNTQLVSEFREAMLRHSSEECEDAESFVWRAAADLGTSLKAKVASLPRNDQMALLAWVSDWKQFWIDQNGKMRKDSWSCSNVGSLKASDARCLEGDKADWQIKRLIFSQGALPMGAAFNINIAGVEGQGLWITISWQATIVDATIINGIVEDMQTWVDRFGKNGHFGIFS